MDDHSQPLTWRMPSFLLLKWDGWTFMCFLLTIKSQDLTLSVSNANDPAHPCLQPLLVCTSSSKHITVSPFPTPPPSTSTQARHDSLSLPFLPKKNAGRGTIHSMLASPDYQACLHNYTEESTVCFTTMTTETAKDAKVHGVGRRRQGEGPRLLPPLNRAANYQTPRCPLADCHFYLFLEKPPLIEAPANMSPNPGCIPHSSWVLSPGKERITVYK